jgi:membrane-bound lytic murein transglycosylase B
MHATTTLAQHAPAAAPAAGALALVAFERVPVSPTCTLLRIAGDWFGSGAPPATATLRVATSARELALAALPRPAHAAAAGDALTWRAAFALPTDGETGVDDRYTLELGGFGALDLPAPTVRTASEAASAQARAQIATTEHLASDLRDRLARTQAELRIARREAADTPRREPTRRVALALGLAAGAVALAIAAAVGTGDRAGAAGSAPDAPTGRFAARAAGPPTARPAKRGAGRRPARPKDATPAARAAVPASYLRTYARAARRYGLDWAVLAAIGQVESRHGAAALPGVADAVNPAGAAGPAQFLFESWRRFGVDGNGDGRIDPYDPADAIAAMAAYLRAHGAPDDWRAAIRAYNHDDAYVDEVLRLAAGFRRG